MAKACFRATKGGKQAFFIFPTSPMKHTLKLAIAQVRPAYNDLHASLEKLAELTAEAAREGAELLVVGESWLTGYPAWADALPGVALWNNEQTKAAFLQMQENALRIPSPESQKLEALARKHDLHLVIGTNELSPTGTLYNVLLNISPQNGIEVHHRKLVPTYSERLLYGTGDGNGLRAVDTPFGKLGGLICWEHWMPLTRQAMHQSGERVHVAVWPSVHEVHQLASRHYAFEGRCFVIAVGQLLSTRDLPEVLQTEAHKQTDEWLLNGGSCVIAPDGGFVLEPQFEYEGLLYVQLDDLQQAERDRITLDVCGHYSRPDVFQFDFDKKRL